MNWGVFGFAVVSVRGSPRAAAASKKVQIYVHIRMGFGPPTGISSARFLTVSRESFEVTVSGGSTFARVKLKEIDGMAPQDVERAV
jgi:hypothetical protein